ncbi:MAG: DnaJ domain-containing protein [Alphaproteobacteria bacterium]|nr:DnaJ domain-containing protein [Alphaproteobacteria bacterium]
MDNTQASYYEILNVSSRASDDEVRRAYRHLAKQFHPDRNPQNRRLAELRFRLISEAYAGLKTRENRIAYNRKLRLQKQNMRAGNDNTRITKGFWAQFGAFFKPANSGQQKT